ncbi:putative membrane protein [Propionispora sp. 2/2-37]|uniref:complex I subunit 4 family protein n=1 Tax=Propionispora sp. 2/2-37 TaxID=1677858 RepID=UPI0006BB58BE|nr:NADH-quinone oxidoreductase subunit M [Propionispora sp. 2/2-37]CUH94767.1 putative membrane protein [Propionispora sp. 2/2-37]
MNDFPLLTIILLLPVAGAVILAFMPPLAAKGIKVIAAAIMGAVALLASYAYWRYDFTAGGMQFTQSIPWIADLGVSYSVGVDGVSLPFLLLTALIGFSAVFASWNLEQRPKEFFILLLILLAGVTGTFIVRDLFIFLLFYELVVIPIYIMVIIWGSTKRVSKEYAGMKLTIYLLLGSAFMLVGIVALYLNAFPEGARTFSMELLAKAHQLGHLSEEFQIFSFFLLLLGFGSLLSMWPFHSWSPDGYAGAPTAVSMIHAGVLKKIGGYGLIRIGLLVLPLGMKFWAPLIAGLAVVNVLYAAFIALAQKDLKYVIGYSSVSHMGYVLIGLAALNGVGISGAVANMFAHGIMSALFFAMIGYVYEKTHVREMNGLGGLAHQMPRVAVGFMLAGMASLGLPGLISFVPEFTIFVGSFSRYPLFAVLAIAGIIFTALYVLRLLANVLFGPRRQELDHYRDARGPELVPLLVLGTVLIAFGLFPNLLMQKISNEVQNMLPLLASLQDAPALWGGIWR